MWTHQSLSKQEQRHVGQTTPGPCEVEAKEVAEHTSVCHGYIITVSNCTLTVHNEPEDPVSAVLDRRIKSIRSFCEKGLLYIFLLAQDDTLLLYLYDCASGNLSYGGMVDDSPVCDVINHPGDTSKVIICHSTEICEHVLSDLKAKPEVTCLKRFLRLLSYDKKSHLDDLPLKTTAISCADVTYVVVWAEELKTAAILSTNWERKKLRLEGMIELPANVEHPFSHVGLLAGGKVQPPPAVSTLVTPAQLISKRIQVEQDGEVQRLYLVLTTIHDIITIPLYICQVDLLTSITSGTVDHHLKFDQIECVGQDQESMYVNLVQPALESNAPITIHEDGQSDHYYSQSPRLTERCTLMMITPIFDRVSTVAIPGRAICVAKDPQSKITVCGTDWKIAIDVDTEEKAASADIPPEDIIERPIEASPADKGSLRLKRNLSPSVSVDNNLLSYSPRNTADEYSLGGGIDLRTFRTALTAELERLQTELFLSSENQLAQLEASIVERLQTHSLVHLTDTIREAISESEARVSKRLDEISKRLDSLGAQIQGRLETSSRPHQQEHEEVGDSRGVIHECRSDTDRNYPLLTVADTEQQEFVDNFNLECIWKAYADLPDNDTDEAKHTQEWLIQLRQALASQRYDSAIFNAASKDLESMNHGFWSVIVTKEFSAKSLYNAKSRGIAMAAVRFLSESLDNWDQLSVGNSMDARSVRAVWKNEIVRVPLALITKCYHSIEPRLRWILCGLSVTHTTVGLSETELMSMMDLLRCKIAKLKSHLENLPDNSMCEKAMIQKNLYFIQVIDEELEKTFGELEAAASKHR